MKKYPYPAVRAIITNKANEILLLKRSQSESYSDFWCLPGGKVDYGFTVEEAMQKEIKEETNLDCKSTEFLFYQDSLPDRNFKEHYITFYFKCIANGDIQINDESESFEWVSFENVKNYKLGFGNREGIERMMKI